MDKRKGARWLYIALFIAVILIGIWMVIDFVLDGRKPEATPPPQVQSSASPETGKNPGIVLENDFTLENLQGDSVTLSEHLGSATVINFWGAWCGWCMYEMPEFAEMVEHYGDDVSFLFVNYGDDAATATEAMEEFGVPLDMVLMDSEDTVTNLFQVDGFPTTFIMDQQGGIVEDFVGATSKDEVMPIIDNLLSE